MQTKTPPLILGCFLSCLILFTGTVLPAHAESLPVFVSIAPQKWLVDQLGGDLVSVHILLDKGQEPHTYQPTPEKMTLLFRSRLYFTLGMPFEREIARKITHKKNPARGLQLIDVTRGIKKIPLLAHHHGDDHEEDHAEDDENDHQEVEQQEYADPHVWLDPRNGKKMAAAITEALISAAPEHAPAFQENLAVLQERLTRLHQELAQQLAPFRGTTFFVFHPSFGYFAHAYELHQEAVEIEGKAPTPKQLYALIKQARADKIKVLFVQPQFDRRSAQTVAQAIKGKLVELDPLAEDIEQNLKSMAEAMQTALTPQ